MNLKIPVSAILDEQFHIQNFLGGSSATRVYKATHNTGVDVVVKFVLDADRFFEELARLYATDGSPYFCSCLYNYPPQSHGQEPLPLDRPVSELLQDTGVPADDCAWDQVGILVLECIDGSPLHEQMAEFDDMGRANALLEVAYALEELHALGEWHGEFTGRNVWMDRETNEIKIIDLGHGSCQKSGEEASEEDLKAKGCAADMAMFAQHFLSKIRRPGRQMRHFVNQCRQVKGVERPTPLDAQVQLKSLRRRLSPKRNLEILYSFFRPINLACWVGVVFGSSFLISNMRNKPVNQRRADLISNTRLSPAGKADAFRELLPKAADEQIRELLIHDIAANSDDKHPKIMSGLDAVKPIAVFAFKQDPLVIGRNEIYRLGDWVRVDEGTEDEQFGYIASIEFNRIKIVYEGAYSWRFFNKPEGYIGVALSSEVAIVWNNEHNLDRLLKATTEVGGMKLFAEHRGGQDTDKGKISGIFLAHSPESFLKTLSSQIPIEVKRKSIFLKEIREDDIPVYVKLSKVLLKDDDLGKLEHLLSEIIDHPVVVAEGIKHEKVTIELYNTTWQELLTALELNWQVKIVNGEKTLCISH
jgi:tRNA A-37 threonylcarbamoyl transferase component Bud32